MPQIKIVLDDAEFDFVNNHASYGFKSKTTLVNQAVAILRQKIQEEMIAKSADLYQEIYEGDRELQELTDDAASICLD